MAAAAQIPQHICDDYRNGLTIRQIAATYGVSCETIRKRLKCWNVTLRSRGWEAIAGVRNPTKGVGHTEAAKAKIRSATYRQFADPEARAIAAHNQMMAISEGRIKAVSQIEGVVAAELTRLGIGYRRQVAIRDPDTNRFCACVDFLLDDGRVLEVNGTYWHTDPRVYPDGPVYASQRRTAEAYAKKSSALSRLGIQIHAIWEADILCDVAKAVNIALTR